MNHSPQSYQPTRVMTNRLGIYLHIPYCRHRCSYCDFFSTVDRPEFDRFGDAVKREIRQMADWWRELGRVESPGTLFFGGGTPSLMPCAVRNGILGTLCDSFSMESNVEITLETNPETVTREFLENLGPVNRLSLGVQSFNPRLLDILDRQCSLESVQKALQLIRDIQFPNWSLDLIIGIPGQSQADLIQDLERAAGAEPNHISVYTLTLKPGHPLFTSLPDDDLGADTYELTVRTLEKWGYPRYEISNFARPGFECRHNLLYWDGGDFLGLGPSSASRYFDGVFHHRKQVSDLNRYLSQKDVREVEFDTTTAEQTRLEAAFLELRKTSGVDAPLFESRYGFDPRKSVKYADFVAAGMVESTKERVRLTPKGLLLADSITADLVPAL